MAAAECPPGADPSPSAAVWNTTRSSGLQGGQGWRSEAEPIPSPQHGQSVAGIGVPHLSQPVWGERGSRGTKGGRCFLGTDCSQLGFSLTLILSTEDKDPVAGDDLELVVLGGANHLNDRQWDHTLGVGLLEGTAGVITLLSPSCRASICPITPASVSLAILVSKSQ